MLKNCDKIYLLRNKELKILNNNNLKNILKIKNKILIPGGTGFIGFHLALFLKTKVGMSTLYLNINQKKKEKLVG